MPYTQILVQHLPRRQNQAVDNVKSELMNKLEKLRDASAKERDVSTAERKISKNGTWRLVLHRRISIWSRSPITTDKARRSNLNFCIFIFFDSYEPHMMSGIKKSNAKVFVTCFLLATSTKD